MTTFETALVYFFLFVSLYFEIFLLITFFGKRKDIIKEGQLSPDELSVFPTVTVIVPCFNEEKTVQKTVESLLAIDYPKDKLSIFVVDDGSKDNTWSFIQRYANHPQIKIYHKENGGKHTALNYGIEHTTSEYVGCLDADSFVDPKTLKKIIRKFLEDEKTMAVTPAMRIYKPSSVVQFIQSTEYIFGILVKKIMAFLGGIHVTPGPFTIFKREVFHKIGMFRPAHNTEDMEIAFRMQSHHLKIENVYNAWVYTVGPNTVKKLYKQRLRWTHGFIENAKDYKHLFFNKKYGNLGMLTLPVASILLCAVLVAVFLFVKNSISFIFHKYIEFKTIGFGYFDFNFGWFYISTKLNILLSVTVFVLMLTLIFTAHKLVEGKSRPTKGMVYFFLLYPLISPFWILKSVYNSILSKKTSWR